LNIPDNEIQSLGLSHRKVEYIKNTFQFFKNNDLEFNELTDDEVINELTKIKGVGEWTAQMFLIFNLFRQDIFSPKDLALINSIKINYKINNLENSRLNELTNSWSPYNSIACLLLWESIENKVFFKT
jgi:DNA-3-methyladenine glycosylase II